MSLFTGCLAVSFLVVGMPHLLPCPVDRRQYSEGGPRRAKRKIDHDPLNPSDDTMAYLRQQDFSASSRRDRECPVPKPIELVKRSLGIAAGTADQTPTQQRVVVVQPRTKGERG